jgi:hypothetical protein
MWPLPRQPSHNLHETNQFPGAELITPDDGHRRCPKHVEFRDKIKFWILDASFRLFTRRKFQFCKGISSGQTAQTKGETLKFRDQFTQVIISFGDCGGKSFE